MSRHRALLLAAACLVGACSDSASDTTEDPEPDTTAASASVVRVIDGDSLELDVDGETIEARLVGINAPELDDCQGPAARDALASVVEGQRPTVRELGTDRFGRQLVELTIAGDSVNEALVRSGWALALHGDDVDWTAEMRAAADAELGMWRSPACPLPSGQVDIVAIQADPPGPDDEALEEEWIVVENVGPAVVDLEGWTLRDESTSNRYVFEARRLSPGAQLRIRTGCGTDSETDLHWCSSNGVWSNRGETALLLAPSGAIVDYLFVEP